jgi:hypothetical protein
MSPDDLEVGDFVKAKNAKDKVGLRKICGIGLDGETFLMEHYRWKKVIHTDDHGEDMVVFEPEQIWIRSEVLKRNVTKLFKMKDGHLEKIIKVKQS